MQYKIQEICCKISSEKGIIRKQHDFNLYSKFRLQHVILVSVHDQKKSCNSKVYIVFFHSFCKI